MKNFKQIFTTLALALFATATFAQVKVGSNPTVLADSANFQVEALRGSQFFIHRGTGNISIGTPAGPGFYNPAFKLQVDGDGFFGGSIAVGPGDAFFRLMPKQVQGAWGPLTRTGDNVLVSGAVTGSTNSVPLTIAPWNGAAGIRISSTSVQLGGNVGIGVETPNASAALHINSTTKGLLIPKMTDPNKLAITNPASGLMVVDTSYGPSLEMNVGTAASPLWRTSTNLRAAYSIRTDHVMGFATNGGGFFSSSALNYTGSGPSGFTYDTGFGSAGAYAFSDGGSFAISTFLPGSGNATLGKANAFVVENSGNVGLGLAQPLAPFHMKAAASTPTDVQELRLASASNSAEAKIGFKQRIGFYGKEEYGAGELYNAGIEVLYGGNNHIPSFPGKSSTSMLFLTGNRHGGEAVERMRINSEGNVGIGTTAPTSKLQVVGLPVHADNAAALAAGLTAGACYHAGDGIMRVVF